VSDASGTLLLDVVKRKWSKQLLAKLELDESLLGTCFESEEITGQLTAAVAKLLGLSTACVVVGGAGDCAAGAVGNGIVKSGLLNTSLGTSGVIFVYSDQPQFDPEGRLHTFCHAVRGKWHMMGVTLCAGGSLQWFHDRVCAIDSHGKPVYEQLTKEAAAVPAGAEGLQFLPYLTGERTPHLDPHARGAFVGLTLSHTRGHLTRAIMEGVTYSLRDSLAIMTDLGVPVKQIRASGGGAKNPFWRQMQASVFGKPVFSMLADEGAAYGVALLAAVGAGEYKDITEACAATIKTADESKPDAPARKVYDRAFPIYQSLYQSLRDEFKKLA
jgi:xylulokinase